MGKGSGPVWDLLRPPLWQTVPSRGGSYVFVPVSLDSEGALFSRSLPVSEETASLSAQQNQIECG